MKEWAGSRKRLRRTKPLLNPPNREFLEQRLSTPASRIVLCHSNSNVISEPYKEGLAPAADWIKWLGWSDFVVQRFSRERIEMLRECLSTKDPRKRLRFQ
jgi:hypothetical protein